MLYDRFHLSSSLGFEVIVLTNIPIDRLTDTLPLICRFSTEVDADIEFGYKDHIPNFKPL